MITDIQTPLGNSFDLLEDVGNSCRIVQCHKDFLGFPKVRTKGSQDSKKLQSIYGELPLQMSIVAWDNEVGGKGTPADLAGVHVQWQIWPERSQSHTLMEIGSICPTPNN